MRMIGILDSASPESRGEELTAFFRGLREAGVNSLTVMVSYVWANNDYHHLTYLAGELVKHGADVIVAAGGPVSAIAAQNVTRTVPIVFTTVANPVLSDLVNRPGEPAKNATGTWGFTTELEPDRMKILGQLVGKPGLILVLANPRRPYPRRPDFDVQRRTLDADAGHLRLEIAVIGAGTSSEIQDAFVAVKSHLDEGRLIGMVVTADPFFNSRREEIIGLVNSYNVPAIYQWPSFVEAGGLMSYGPSKAEGYRNAGDMVGQILNKGKTPAELPVRKTEEFELVISKSRAASFGIRVPSDWEGRPVRELP